MDGSESPLEEMRCALFDSIRHDGPGTVSELASRLGFSEVRTKVLVFAERDTVVGIARWSRDCGTRCPQLAA